MILYRYREEKFCLGHSQELKGYEIMFKKLCYMRVAVKFYEWLTILIWKSLKC